MADKTGPLLTPRDVAKLFNVDPKTVTRWANAGKLPFVLTPGGHRRFFRRDVDAFLTGGKQDGDR